MYGPTTHRVVPARRVPTVPREPAHCVGFPAWLPLWGVGTVIVWSGVVSVVAYKLVDIVIGLRVPEDEEREGLDLTSHGESAYHH